MCIESVCRIRKAELGQSGGGEGAGFASHVTRGMLKAI